MINKNITVLYLGISSPDFSRNRVYIKSLEKQGVSVLKCFDNAPGIKKFINLWKKHRELVGKYDVVFVAYPGHVIVWFARLLTRKPVVFDALASFYESEVLSRHPGKKISFFALKMWLIDFFACFFSTVTLVESELQVEYFHKMFGISKKKCFCVYTGVDEDVFKYDPTAEKNAIFTVVFRGKFLPEAGVRNILEAAKILIKENIRFEIYGFGFLENEIKQAVAVSGLENLVLDTQEKSFSDLSHIFSHSHLSLGQLSSHNRLERTIPHKAFESMAMKIPYITARSRGVEELLSSEESAFVVNPDDPKDLARIILMAKNDYERALLLANNAYKIYLEKASNTAIGEKLVSIINKLM